MKSKSSEYISQSRISADKNEVRLYNMILPPFMLMTFCPLFWIGSFVGNFIIDSVFLLIISLIFLRKFDKSFYKKTIFKVWLCGFASDFVGLLFLCGFGLTADASYYEGDDIYRQFMSGIYMAVNHSDTTSFWAVIFLASGVVVAALFIFFFSFSVSLRETALSRKQRLFSSIILAVGTAPYTYFLPKELFYG